MKKYAAKIDLSDFFDDERKLVLILIDNAWQNVECLQNKLQTMFGIDGVRFLTNEGYFLPPQESIEVVKFVDVLKAFMPAEFLTKKQKKNKKLKRKRAAEQSAQELSTNGAERKEVVTTEEHITRDSPEKNKRKYFSLGNGFCSSTPNEAKRCKNMLEDHATFPNVCKKSNEISSSTGSTAVNELISTTKNKGNKSKRQNKQVISNDCNDLENQKEHSNKKQNSSKSNNTSDASNNHAMQPLRSENEKPYRESCDFRMASNRTSSLLDEYKTGLISKPEKLQHIYYNESGEAVSTTTDSDGTIKESKNVTDVENVSTDDIKKIIFRCSLEEIAMNEPRLFKTDHQSKSKIDIIKNVMLPAYKANECSSLVVADKEIIDNIEKSENTIECESLNVTELNDGQNETQQTTHEFLEVAEKTKNSLMSVESMNVTEQNESDHVRDEIVQFPEKTANSMMECESLYATEQHATQNMTHENLEVAETTGNGLIEGESLNVPELQEDQNDTDHMITGEKAEITETTNSIAINDKEMDDSQIETKDKTKNVTEQIEDEEESTLSESHIINLEEDDDGDVEEVSSVIDLSESEDVSTTNRSRSTRISTLRNSSSILDDNDLNISKMLPFSTELKELPLINDIVLFKMVATAGSRYMTKYIAGKCEYINKRTKNIKLLLTDGKSEIKLIPSKFIVSLDDSSQELLYINIKFEDMIQPKVFQM